jgi:hypothetical protein
MAHLIVRPPDFDHVVSVNASGLPISDSMLEKGVKVVFKGSKNTAATRLKEKQETDGEITTSTTSGAKKIHIKVNRELYFEEGELQVPAKFSTTAEERKAGFL